MPASNTDFSVQHVNLEDGLISRDVFTDESIYARELERIFARSWLFVGHNSQIPNPGDFILGRSGEESVIVNRDRHDVIHVFRWAELMDTPASDTL